VFNRELRPPRIDTLIGKPARVYGDLEFSGGLHLDGTITGNVRAAPGSDSTLSVSDTGSIEGTVEVSNVILGGTVKGDIQAEGRLFLDATARVEGNVYYGVIEMTLGAQIMGKLMRISVQSPAAPEE
jgi:cytoskeletal protein CcmA (bactofilin family)